MLRVLKGHLATGEQEVSYREYDYPRREPGEFVAFLDKERNWIFTAAPLRGRKVDAGLLRVSAFDLVFAPTVSPEGLSLAQLAAYLKTGKLFYSFRGRVWFPEHGKSGWVPSDMRIEGSYEVVTKSVRVTGLGQLAGAGFLAEPSIDMTKRDDNLVLQLTYSNRGDRPLRIRGEVEGLDQKTGALVARFVVTTPDVLNEATLKKYLTDKRLGRCSYAFRLRCLATKDYPNLDLVLILDGDNRVEGFGSSPLEIDTADLTIESRVGTESFGMLRDVPGQASSPIADAPSNGVLRVVTEARRGQTVVLDFYIAKSTKDNDVPPQEFIWERAFKSVLLYRVNSGPVHGTVSLYDGKALRPITKFSVDISPVAFGTVSVK